MLWTAQGLWNETHHIKTAHPSPYQPCFAAEPSSSRPSLSRRWFSHQMMLLKAGLDFWGTTGRQNTTGLSLEARKWPNMREMTHDNWLHHHQVTVQGRGHLEKWQLRSYTSPVFGFQQRIRLSLALLSRSSESAWLQDMDRIPLEENTNNVKYTTRWSKTKQTNQSVKASPCVVLKDFEGWCCKTEVPHLDDWQSVIFRGQHQLSGYIRVPEHSWTVHLDKTQNR